MRFALAAALLLGDLVACSQGSSENAPPPAAAAAMPEQPMPAMAPSGGPAMPMAMGQIDGHYVGQGMAAGGPGCAREMNFDFTVANGQVTGTATVPAGRGQRGRGSSSAGAVSDLTGQVDASGKAVLEMAAHGQMRAHGKLTGTFANGQFTGHRGPPCERQVTAARQ